MGVDEIARLCRQFIGIAEGKATIREDVVALMITESISERGAKVDTPTG